MRETDLRLQHPSLIDGCMDESNRIFTTTLTLRTTNALEKLMIVDHGLLENEVQKHLPNQIYHGTKGDWIKTDFNHYDKSISTAFKTMLKSDL